MIKKEYKFSLNRIIFFTTLICFIIKQISVYSVLPEVVSKYGLINKGMELLILGLFFWYICISKYSIRRIVVILIILLTSLISLSSKNKDIFFIGLLLYMSVNVKSKDIIKISMVTLGFTVLSIVSLSFMNIIPNYVYDNILANGNIAKANSLGFDYYSYVPIYTLFFTCMYLYIRGKKCSYIEICILILLAIVVNSFCHKELAFGLNIFTVILYIILSKFNIFKFRSYIWKLVSKVIIPSCFIIIVFCSYNYDKFLALDNILGGRLYYGYTTFNNYSLTLFGQNIEMIGTSTFTKNPNLEYFYIDSGYLQTLFLRGIILTAIIVIGYSIISYKSIKDKEIELFIWVIITAGYNILGSTLIDIWYNPIFFIGFKYIANWRGTFNILGTRYRVVYKKVIE